MSKKKIRISIVNYTNTLPFKWALTRNPIIEKIDLQEDIPSICAQKLKYKQVDIALVPVALLSELDNYYIETDFCIGADGKVDSVKLYSQVPLDQVKTVALDYQSKSSITLTKVLFRFFWKVPMSFSDSSPGFEDLIKDTHAAVVIGDRTFSMNGKYAYEFDLAEEWKKFTGLPFVFAAWVSTEKLPESFIKKFNSVLKHGADNIEKAVNDDYKINSLSKSLTVEYLTQRIDYNFDETKMKALNLFLEYIKRL